MWKHVIIDDFLSKKHFDYINEVFDTKPIKNKKPQIVSHSYRVNADGVKQYSNFKGNIISDKFDQNIIREIYETYTPRLMDILKELAPEKVSKYHHSAIIFVVTPKDHVYPNHTDTEHKLLSVVVYLKPDNNTGTILYETKDKKNPKTVEWKPNRALIFSRSDNTWHSYQGDGVNDRYALVFNLTADVDEFN